MPWTGRKMPGLVGESPLLYNFLKQKQRNVPRNSLCPALNNPTVKELDSSETFSPGPHSVRIDVFDVFCPTREFWPRWDAVVQSRQGTLGQHAGWSPWSDRGGYRARPPGISLGLPSVRHDGHLRSYSCKDVLRILHWAVTPRLSEHNASRSRDPIDRC